MQRNNHQMTPSSCQLSQVNTNDTQIRNTMVNQLQTTASNNQGNNIPQRVLLSANQNMNGQLQIVQHGDRLIAVRQLTGQEVKGDHNQHHQSEASVVDASISTLVSEVIVSSSMMNRAVLEAAGSSHQIPVTSSMSISSSGVIVTNSSANMHNSNELDEQLILDIGQNGMVNGIVNGQSNTSSSSPELGSSRHNQCSPSLSLNSREGDSNSPPVDQNRYGLTAFPAIQQSQIATTSVQYTEEHRTTRILVNNTLQTAGYNTNYSNHQRFNPILNNWSNSPPGEVQLGGFHNSGRQLSSEEILLHRDNERTSDHSDLIIFNRSGHPHDQSATYGIDVSTSQDFGSGHQQVIASTASGQHHRYQTHYNTNGPHDDPITNAGPHFLNVNSFINMDMDEVNGKKHLQGLIHGQPMQVFKSDKGDDGGDNYSQVHHNSQGIPQQHSNSMQEISQQHQANNLQVVSHGQHPSNLQGIQQHPLNSQQGIVKQHPNSLHGDGIGSGEGLSTRNLGSPPVALGPGAALAKHAPQSQVQFCAICNDRATGKHYGAPSCDGCKGFFRRSVRKKHSYSCRFDRKCVMDKDKRNQCRYCRLRKCFKAGMKSQAVQNERDRISVRTPSFDEQLNTTGISVQSLLMAELKARFENFLTDSDGPCQMYGEKKLASITGISEAIKQQLRGIVEWIKLIPAITELKLDDQVALIRAHSGDHLLLGLARRSIREEDYLLLSNDHVIHRHQGHGDVCRIATRILDELVQTLRSLKVNDTEIALLKAIVFLDPNVRGLTEQEKVRQLRRQVTLMLEDFTTDRQYDGRGRFGEILLTVPVLQSIKWEMITLIQLAQTQGQIKMDNLLEEMLLGAMSDNQSQPTATSKSSALFDYVAKALSMCNGQALMSANAVDSQHQAHGNFYYEEDASGLFFNPNLCPIMPQGMSQLEHQQQMVQDLQLSQSHAHPSMVSAQHGLPQNESNVVTSSTSVSSASSSPEAGYHSLEQSHQSGGHDGSELIVAAVTSGNVVLQHSHNRQQHVVIDNEAMQALLNNQQQQQQQHMRVGTSSVQRLHQHQTSGDQRDSSEVNDHQTGDGQSFKTEVMDVERTY